MSAVAPTSDRLALRGLALLSLRQGVTLVATLSGIVVLAHLLTPAQYLTYGLVNVAMLTGAASGDLGLGARLVRFGATADALGRSLGLQLAFWGVVQAVGSVGVLIAFRHADTRAAGLGVLATLTFFSLATLPIASLEAVNAFARVGTIELAQRLGFIALAIAFAALHPSVWSVPIAGAASGALGCAVALTVSHWRERPRLRNSRILLRGFAVDWFLSRVANQLNYASIVVISGLLLDSTDAGYVSWALNLASIPTLLAPLAARALLPNIARVEAAQRIHTYRRLLRALLAIALPMIVVLFVCGASLADTVFGETWLGAVGQLRLACATAVLGTFISPLMPLLFVELSTRWVRNVMMIWTSVSSVATLALTAAEGPFVPLALQVAGGVLVLWILRRALLQERGFDLLAGNLLWLAAAGAVCLIGALVAPRTTTFLTTSAEVTAIAVSVVLALALTSRLSSSGPPRSG